MTHWPAAASWCKSQFAMRNGKGTVTHRRLMLVIDDAHTDALSRSDLLGIICDGGLEVSKAIDVGDHRGGRLWQCTGVNFVAQRRGESQRDGGSCLRKDIPRTELTAFRRGRCPPKFLRNVLIKESQFHFRRCAMTGRLLHACPIHRIHNGGAGRDTHRFNFPIAVQVLAS